MRKRLREAVCRHCGSDDVWLEVKEMSQTKGKRLEVPWLVCDGCGNEAELLP